VQICVDDFGTGYSSLSYLQRLPIDVLKIDRSFVQQIGSESQNEIVQTIVALARALGLQAVAEGTETMQQVTQLRELRCDYGQGWLFARALEPEQAEAMLQAELPVEPPAEGGGEGIGG
jgi:EAL domain-containing protein (putative c-di-GMP-specific phosphodiesterase class I)